MDQEAKQMLSDIIAKPIAAMSEYDKAFVRARRDYLTEAQAADLKSVLEEGAEEEEDEVDYSKLLKEDLIALCSEREIEMPEKPTKALLIELLEEGDKKDEE